MFHPFWTKDKGVVTIDYVVVMAALVGVGVWMADTTNADLSEHSAVIRGEMQGGMFETAWDADLAVLPDTEAGDQCNGADTCGTGNTGGGSTGGGTTGGGTTGGGTTGGGTTGGGTTGGGTTGGGTTGGGTTGGGTNPDPDPDPDPNPDPDPDPDPNPDPDPDPNDPNDPNAGGNNDPFPPTASPAVAGCPNNFYDGSPLVSDGSDFGNSYDHTITHSGFTDLRTCGGGMPYARGFFDANPTFTMYLSDMTQFDTVQFLVEATSCDTTLLIRDASGTFHFNDDYNYPSHTRSRLRLTDTADLNGRVDIWIGGYYPSTCSTRLEVRGW
ncbi:hypothetical protein [Gymnodinialimonas hymeniacidonis]|uniref:hypothetical protein n=1 Tax=Gymnodinialimonas hymeniacidonis TaxID=3126508 RepID=UPI0034C6C362